MRLLPTTFGNYTTKKETLKNVSFFVGVLWLEHRTLWSQTRCASQLRHTPFPRMGLQIYAIFSIQQKKLQKFALSFLYLASETEFHQNRFIQIWLKQKTWASLSVISRRLKEWLSIYQKVRWYQWSVPQAQANPHYYKSSAPCPPQIRAASS